MRELRLTAQLPLRSLVLVLVALTALTALAGHMYVLKKPAAELNGAKNALFDLRRAHPANEPVQSRIDAAASELELLREKLQAAGPNLAANEMIAFVIGRLDKLARRQRIQLISVEPGDVAQVFDFDEIPFHVEVVGGYFQLVDWLHDAERELGPMIVKSFDIAPDSGEDLRRMRVTMVSYRARAGAA